jgi:three-Cys-motif partner protein
MAAKNDEKSASTNPPDPPIGQDPCPTLIVERGPDDKGVGAWVPTEKHRLLQHYLDASRYARRKWSSRVFIDPFCGPGRIQVVGESFTRPGAAIFAYEASMKDAPFTQVLIGDLDNQRAQACEQRLMAIGAPTRSFPGPARQTIQAMTSAVPAGSLCTAYVDPYNLEVLSFSILQELAKLRKIDLAVNFSTMDLQRNVELEFDPERARFDDVASDWRKYPQILAASRANVKLAFLAIGVTWSKVWGLSTANRCLSSETIRATGSIAWCFSHATIFPKASGMMSRAIHIELWTCLARESFMKGPLSGLVAVTTAVIIILDCWATVVVARQIDLPRAQRRLQLLFIWLLPVVGAMISLRIHRPDKSYRARSSGASNDVYPAGIGPEDSGSHADGWD